MKSYLDILNYIQEKGKYREDRTGVGTLGIFGYQWRHDLANGFPLLTTKKIHTKSVIIELLWFLSGDTNIKFLQDNGVTIWNEWASPDGDLGPVYGKQWRNFNGVDQIATLIDGLKNNPFSRRHIVSAWNPKDVPSMALPPCHTLWQCYVEEVADGIYTKKRLSLHLYARSIDTFLGLPFNIASYAFLLHMLAEVTGMTPGDLVISFGDLHIYSNHMEQVNTQLSREPFLFPLPKFQFKRKVTDINDFKFEDFEITGYQYHPSISAPIAV